MSIRNDNVVIVNDNVVTYNNIVIIAIDMILNFVCHSKLQSNYVFQEDIIENKNVTLKLISQHTGLSVATVGRVFSAPEKVKPETLALVRNKANELGYKANLAGKSLRTGKSYEIAVMLPFDRKESAEFMGAAQYNLISGFASVFHGVDYNMKLLPYTEQGDVQEIFERYLKKNKPDAFIITQLEPQDKRIKRLIKDNIPFITFGKSDSEKQHNFFDYDNYAFGYEAASEMISNGCNSIILIILDDNYMHYKLQIAGFKDALRDNNITFEERMILRINAEDNIQTQKDIFKIIKQVDAIITVSPQLVYLIKQVANEHSRQLGQDILLSCATATPNLLRMLDVKCKCYYQDFANAGVILAQNAVDLADGKEITNINLHYQIINM